MGQQQHHGVRALRLATLGIEVHVSGLERDGDAGPAQARLLASERAAAGVQAGRRGDRGVQKNFAARVLPETERHRAVLDREPGRDGRWYESEVLFTLRRID